MQILYEDNHLLVVRKPAGVLIQGDRTGDVSLHEQAKEYLKQKYHKPGKVFLGIVHRLDRPTAGVVVFARTSKAASRLSDQFRRRSVRKIYWALVEGRVPDGGDFSDRIHRNSHRSKILTDQTAEAGKAANLRYHRKACSNGVSWVEIDLGSGRHHQIRVQFAHRGHPVWGDFRYGSKRKFPRRTIALMARSLTVTHPVSQEPMTFVAEPEADWPAEFRES